MLLAAMALIASAGATAPAADARPICQSSELHSVDSPSPEAQLKRLDELPPANLVLTVLRTEDGCSAPVIVRYGIGAPAKTDK
jgi:hypothetical protein